MTECIVCKEVTKKYKCPKCFQPYCSLICYKKHKDAPDCLTNTKDSDEGKFPKHLENQEEPTVHEPFTTEDTVPKERLQLLETSEHLKNLLCNSHLRNLLTEIDTAPSAWNAIKVAMQEPLFLEFADECLKVVEPMCEED